MNFCPNNSFWEEAPTVGILRSIGTTELPILIMEKSAEGKKTWKKLVSSARIQHPCSRYPQM
jgi:hypothetical protein